MSALFHDFAKTKLSLSLDGLTIYHANFPQKAAKEIRKIPGYVSTIMREDDEHNLFHRDLFNRDDYHWHFAFDSMIDRGKLSRILDILIKYNCISDNNKNIFMQSYDARYQQFITPLKLTHRDKYKDTASIIKFIKQCNDNDLLVHLHKHLLDSKFDYLRARTGRFSFSFWRGTNKKGETVETSRSWAMIEKTLALQMGINICDQATKFTPQFAEKKSRQLACFYPFFMIARYFFSWPLMGNSSFEAFSRGDEIEFREKRYQHFRYLH